MRGTAEERFWEKVQIRGDGDCWEWKPCRHKQRYGTFWTRGRVRRAHRVSWYFVHGEIPEGMCICHHCDNKACVNPAHLFLGTVADNNADKKRKGRQRYPEGMNQGERNGSAKLTEDNVRAIRREVAVGIPQCILAEKYNVSRTTICNTVCRKVWKHVE